MYRTIPHDWMGQARNDVEVGGGADLPVKTLITSPASTLGENSQFRGTSPTLVKVHFSEDPDPVFPFPPLSFAVLLQPMPQPF